MKSSGRAMVKRRRSCGGNDDDQPVHGEYEKVRQARIEENRMRMMQLGLTELSKSVFRDVKKTRPAPRKRAPPSAALLQASRRSARLQSRPAPCYYDSVARKEKERGDRPRRNAANAGTGGPREEIYSQEHEKLLGNAKQEWELFKDGYQGGVRIYDPARGKTCHQCRQKTMGKRTYCNDCQSIQGQFCGDCLYMRYGENVQEALADENWKCPICRDICNCSICRHRKGWAPTGSLYRTAVHQGYKSVAHFLILTRRAGSNPDKAIPAASDPSLVSEELPAAKRELDSEEDQDGATDAAAEAAAPDAFVTKSVKQEVVSPAAKPKLEKTKAKEAPKEINEATMSIDVVVISDSEGEKENAGPIEKGAGVKIPVELRRRQKFGHMCRRIQPSRAVKV